MSKYSTLPCCGCCDLTLATRWIGFFGLALSTALTSVIISDKRAHNFDNSRTLAAAFGLDWQHFHRHANATHAADYDGKLISVIMVFYSVVYLLTNMVLIFASITESRWCTIPWIAYEIFSCVSKTFAMFHHWFCDQSHFSTLFYVGSIIYIVVAIWWIIVVFLAQNRWKLSEEISLITPQKNCITLNTLHDGTQGDEDVTVFSEARFSYYPQRTQSLEINSPSVYVPNLYYCPI